jgi:hypothetical protein
MTVFSTGVMVSIAWSVDIISSANNIQKGFPIVIWIRSIDISIYCENLYVYDITIIYVLKCMIYYYYREMIHIVKTIQKKQKNDDGICCDYSIEYDICGRLYIDMIIFPEHDVYRV